MLRSDLCDYSDAYIVVEGVLTVSAEVCLKNNVPFIFCISKINGVLIENSEDLDVVMPM